MHSGKGRRKKRPPPRSLRCGSWGPSGHSRRRRQGLRAAGTPCPHPSPPPPPAPCSPPNPPNGRRLTCPARVPSPTPHPHPPLPRVARLRHRVLGARPRTPPGSRRRPASSAFSAPLHALPAVSSPRFFLRPRRRRLCQPPCAAQRAIPRPHHPRRSAPASPGGHVTASGRRRRGLRRREPRGAGRGNSEHPLPRERGNGSVADTRFLCTLRSAPSAREEERS